MPYTELGPNEPLLTEELIVAKPTLVYVNRCAQSYASRQAFKLATGLYRWWVELERVSVSAFEGLNGLFENCFPGDLIGKAFGQAAKVVARTQDSETDEITRMVMLFFYKGAVKPFLIAEFNFISLSGLCGSWGMRPSPAVT